MPFVPPYEATWGLAVLSETDWSIEISAYGNGLETRAELTKICSKPAPESARRHLRSAVVHQATLFPIVEPSTRFLLPLCMESPALRESLFPFWREWQQGIDQMEPCVSIPQEQLAQTREMIRQAIVGVPLDFGCLFEEFQEFDDDVPLAVMMRHANSCANLIRPAVIGLYPELSGS